MTVQTAPVNFYRKPKPFDRDKALSEWARRHPGSLERAARLPHLAARRHHDTDPRGYFQTQLTHVLLDRMQGLPIVNASLDVDVLPFEAVQVRDVTQVREPVDLDVWFGLAVTPWSVQAVLAARNEASILEMPAGTKRDIELEGGVFTFIVTEDSLLGHCAMCSLKSPVFEFTDGETARAFALACASLMTGRQPIVEESEVENPKLSPQSAAPAPQPSRPAVAKTAGKTTPATQSGHAAQDAAGTAGRAAQEDRATEPAGGRRAFFRRLAGRGN